MNRQLQVYQGLEFGALSTQDVATIRETIAKDTNDSQFRLFMGVAKSSGANPLTNEIYAAVRGGQLTIQYGYDFYVRKAKESEGYLGYDVQLVHENDEVEISRKTDEQGRSYMVVNDHAITFPRGKIIAAYAIAFRKDVSPFTVFMEVDSVDHLRRSNIGMQKTMWTNYFDDMFKKHVLRRALKGQFGLEFDDQVTESNNAANQPKERKDITPTQNQINDKQPQQTQTEQQPEVSPVNDLKAEINEKFKQLGITTREQVNEYLQKNAPQLNPATASESELVGLIELLDMNLDMMSPADDADTLE